MPKDEYIVFVKVSEGKITSVTRTINGKRQELV